jgi:predicted nucleotidyltransferase
MVTIRALNQMLADLYQSLAIHGYPPAKMVLFGSYAKGTPRHNSDIDIAIWSPLFSGSISMDMEFLAPVKRNFPMMELHTFTMEDTEFNHPFVEEILKTGKVFEVGKDLVFY